MEKLINSLNELQLEEILLNNQNHRLRNEIQGVKRDYSQLELERDNIKRENNLYAKQESDANMEYVQTLEKRKNLDEAISVLKGKNLNAETKLKQQKKIYEALRADCNRFEKKFQDAQKEIKEVVEDKTKKQHKYQNLKIELCSKQTVYQTTLESLGE
jgi:chromosome segregation ATPase